MGQGGDGGRGWRWRFGGRVSVGVRLAGYDAQLAVVGRLPQLLNQACLGTKPFGHEDGNVGLVCSTRAVSCVER